MCAAGYEPYIMFCLTHPQMMMVHKLMLGPEIRHDHNTLLYRKEGFPGQNWHSHAHHEGAARGEGLHGHRAAREVASRSPRSGMEPASPRGSASNCPQ